MHDGNTIEQYCVSFPNSAFSDMMLKIGPGESIYTMEAGNAKNQDFIYYLVDCLDFRK